MLRIIGTSIEKLNEYRNPQKVVFTVITGGQTVYVATDQTILRSSVGGQQQGTPITSTAQVALDVMGQIWWVASAAGVQVDVLEAGAL